MNGKQLLQLAIAEVGAEKRLEAELLLCHVLDTSRALLLAHDTDAVSDQQAARYQQLIGRYKAEEPLQYLMGTANFMGLDLLVTPAVLIPRFDTERLVEKSLQVLADRPRPVVLDVCTGSGAIALAISHYRKDAVVWAGDLSAAALEVARENNDRCGASVQFAQGNLLEPFAHLQGQLDLLVSNPPYITTGEMLELPGDVQQEPRLALWGGDDGLYFYRKITAQAVKMLKPNGWLAFEVGWQQGEAVKQLLAQQGFTDLELLQDWQGLDRVVCGKQAVHRLKENHQPDRQPVQDLSCE